MARPRTSDLSLEDRIEAQTLEWLRVSGIAAKIAGVQSEGFLKLVQGGELAAKQHVEISEVMRHIIDGASTAIQAGSKLLAARKAGTGVDTTFDEAALADELHGKVG